MSDTIVVGNAPNSQINNVAVDSRGVALIAGAVVDGTYKSWVRMIAPCSGP